MVLNGNDIRKIRDKRLRARLNLAFKSTVSKFCSERRSETLFKVNTSNSHTQTCCASWLGYFTDLKLMYNFINLKGNNLTIL